MTGIRAPWPLSPTTPAAASPLRRLARLGVPLTALTALAVLAAPAAQAATWTHTDAAGDVQVISRNVGDPTKFSGPRINPRERRGDLGRVTVRHQDQTVRVAISVRDDAPAVVALVTLATSRGETFRAVYDSGQQSSQDRARLWREGREVACDDLRFNPTSSGYLATVPRECLGLPYRVRVGVQTQTYTAGGADDVTREISDDALRTGRFDRYAPRLSPWVPVSRTTPAPQRTSAAPAAHRTSDRAARTVSIRPESLRRGAEVKGAHMASPTSNTIVDGDTRVTVHGDNVSLLGTYRSSYVVYVRRGDETTVRRVGPGGSEQVVARDVEGGVTMSADDARPLLAVTSTPIGSRRTTVVVRSVASGKVYRSRTFAAYTGVLDLQGDTAQAIIDSDAGTYRWDLSSDEITLLTRRTFGRADFDANRLSTLTGDPYDGGCTIVSTITRPQTTLWKSCSERVDAFSPDGRRMATVHILSDGQGPGLVRTRSVRGGGLLGAYEIDGYFTSVTWESAKVLLLDAFGQDKTATVRCTGSSCERASALDAAPES